MRENDWAPSKTELLALNCTVLRLTPEEGSQRIKKLAGEEATLDVAKTVFVDEDGGRAEILIDSTLDEGIQACLLAHEIKQLESIRNYESGGHPRYQIYPHAHFSGLRAGLDLAIKLGIADEYLQFFKDIGGDYENLLGMYRDYWDHAK